MLLTSCPVWVGIPNLSAQNNAAKSGRHRYPHDSSPSLSLYCARRSMVTDLHKKDLKGHTFKSVHRIDLQPATSGFWSIRGSMWIKPQQKKHNTYTWILVASAGALQPEGSFHTEKNTYSRKWALGIWKACKLKKLVLIPQEVDSATSWIWAPGGPQSNRVPRMPQSTTCSCHKK